MRNPTRRLNPEPRTSPRRPAMVLTWLLLALATLLPSILVLPTAVAHQPMSAASVGGVRGIDFRGVDHGIDEATSAIAVEAVRHGDLDGDGAEDAVVVLAFDTAHGPRWAVQTYAATGSGATPLGRTHAFNAAWEHFDRIAVRDGVVEFTVRSGVDERPMGTSSTAALSMRNGWLEVQRWALVGDGLRLVQQRAGGEVRTLDSVGPVAPPVLPDWTTRSYLDVAPGGTRRGVLVETSEAKSLRMRADDASAQIRVYDTVSGRLVAQVDAGEVADLRGTGEAGSGTWYVEPVTASDRWTRIELMVADQRALFAPELVAQHEEWAAADDPEEARRVISLAWYEVAWAHGPVDLERVNGLIRDHVRSIRADHEAAAAACGPDEDATLYVGATPELVSYDLVSLHFTIASCLCERNDEVVEESILIDLAAGALIEADAVIANTALATQAWWDAFTDYQAQHLGPLAVPIGSPVDLSSVSVTASGIAISVDAGHVLADIEPGGAGWAIRQVVAFDEHPGVVAADLERRARSGRDVTLPYHGCGC